jgi:hypothetical protein
MCNVNRERTRGRLQYTIKDSMNNMMIQDLNNMVDLSDACRVSKYLGYPTDGKI